MRQRHVRFVVKAALTIAVVYFLIYAINVSELFERVRAIPSWSVLFAVVLWSAATLINTWRWQLLLGMQNIRRSFLRLLAYNLIFAFYTVVLPGGKVSAEAVRIYHIVRDVGSDEREPAALSALADRTVAVLMLAALAAAALPIVSLMAPVFPAWLWYALIISTSLATAGLIVPFEHVLVRIARFFPHLVGRPMGRLGEAFRTYRTQPRSFIAVFMLSLLSALAMTFGVHVLVIALGVTAPFAITLAAFSLGTLAAMIPLTLAGIGIREGVFAFVFSLFAGVPIEVGLSVSLVALAASLVIAVFGGFAELYRVFFLVRPARSNSQPIVLAINDLDFGGAQRTVVEEANELVRRNMSVIVAVILGGAKMGLSEDLDSRVRVVRFEFASIADIKTCIHFARFLRATRPRAVISNLFFANTVVRLAKLCAPFVPVFVREGNVPREKSWTVKMADVVLSAVTERVFVNARTLAEPVQRVNPFTHVEVLSNGINRTFFKPSVERASMRAALNIPDNSFVAIAVGSLTAKKGHAYLLSAMRELPDARCLIVGDGYLRATLEARAPKNVIFLGARTDVRALYAAADVFVLPSLWEGMPNVMLEALAAGLPAIVTDVGGVSEVVRDGENGFLVASRNDTALVEKLRVLKDDSSIRSRMAQKAQHSVAHLTWEKHVDTLLSVL